MLFLSVAVICGRVGCLIKGRTYWNNWKHRFRTDLSLRRWRPWFCKQHIKTILWWAEMPRTLGRDYCRCILINLIILVLYFGAVCFMYNFLLRFFSAIFLFFHYHFFYSHILNTTFRLTSLCVLEPCDNI